MVEVICLASGSAGNAYALDDGESVLLLEAGIPAKKSAAGFFPLLSRVAGCFITHEHNDHAQGAAGLARQGIDLYASAGTFSRLPDIRHPYRRNIIRAGEQVETGSWLAMPWAAQHDATEPLGFLFYSKTTEERVLFATDTGDIPHGFRGLNVLLLECNYAENILRENVQSGRLAPTLAERIQRTHLGLDAAKDFLSRCALGAVRQIFLIHISRQNGDPARFQKEIRALTGCPVRVLGC